MRPGESDYYAIKLTKLPHRKKYISHDVKRFNSFCPTATISHF